MYILFDPQFWIIQIVLAIIAWMLRALPEILLWRARRKVRWFMESMSPEEADRWKQKYEEQAREAPGRMLELLVTYSFLRREGHRIRRAERELRSTMRMSTAEAAAAKGANRVKPIRPPRKPLSSRLTNTFTVIAGNVVGGEEGTNYVRAWRAELSELKNPVMKVTHALSNLIGAVRIRLITKTSPHLRRIFVKPAAFISAGLDTIASSPILAGLLVGCPFICALVIAGYIIGKMPLAFSTAIGGSPVVYWAVESWRRRRMRRRHEANGKADS